MKKLILALCVSSAATVAHATAPTFTNLSQQDFIGVVNDFSGVYSYTSVSPASPLGKIFGFEVGLVGGMANTPRIKTLVAENDSSANISEMPDAALLGVVTLPFGLTGEVEYLPKESATNSSVTDTSIAVAFKWTFTEFLRWPFDAALKVYSKTAELTFDGPVGGVDTSFDFKDSLSGAELEFSKSFIVFEPYINIGVEHGSGSMSVSGSNQVFQSSYTNSQSASEAVTGSNLALGVNVNLVILKLGAEIGQAFGNGRAAAKVSFYF